MIKSFTNDKGVKYLFVGVPEASIQHQVYMGCLVYKEPNYENWATHEEMEHPIKCQEYLDRTEGKEQYKDAAINLKCDAKFIGLSKDLTEEQCDKNTDEYYHSCGTLNGYIDYRDETQTDCPKESVYTLMESLGFKESDNIAVLEVTG